jgi:hypothetical protein
MPTVTNTSPVAPNFYYASDTALGGTVVGVGLVGASSAPPFLWTLEIDNTLNAVPVYVKFWAMPSSAVTIGSTPPTMQFAASASKKQTYSFVGPGSPLTSGTPYADFGWACVLEPGTPGSTAPTADVAVRILFQQDP